MMGRASLSRLKAYLVPRVTSAADVRAYVVGNTLMCVAVVIVISYFEADLTDRTYLATILTGVATVLVLAPGLLYVNSAAHLRNHRLMQRHRQAYRSARASSAALAKQNIELEAMREQLAHLANCDFLTGLSNRRRFETALDDAFSAFTRTGQSFALITLDLDRFKPVNDLHGHDAGDAVLRHVAVRLRKVLRDVPSEIARLGGDEFVVILQDNPSAEMIETLTADLNRAMDEPHAYKGTVLSVGASFGVAVASADFAQAGDMMLAADRALLQSKTQSGSAITVHRALGTARRVLGLARTG